MQYYASSQTIPRPGEGEAGGELFGNTGIQMRLFPSRITRLIIVLKHQKQRASKQTDRSRQALQVFSIISHNALQESADDVMDRCGRTDRGGGLIYTCSKGRSAACSAHDGRTCRERRRYGEGFDLQVSGGSGAVAGLLKMSPVRMKVEPFARQHRS